MADATRSESKATAGYVNTEEIEGGDSKIQTIDKKEYFEALFKDPHSGSQPEARELTPFVWLVLPQAHMGFFFSELE